MTTPLSIAHLCDAMDAFAPLDGAEEWDRVGLHVGRREDPLAGPVLLTIDLTERVLDEAIAMKAGAIVSYHPPIWMKLERVTDATPTERIVHAAIRAGIAIYSPHTALDATEGGITDWLCEGIAGVTKNDGADGGRLMGDSRALRPSRATDAAGKVKIVTFVPASSVDQVRGALATAGAGLIGEYSVCSFTSTGTGTFLAGEGADPVVGERGRLEEVEELRLEMICNKSALPLAIETLRHFHPYEEPAIDAYKLLPIPRRSRGAGRRLVLDQPATLAEIGTRLKAHLGRSRIKIALPAGDRPVRSVGVVPGAGAEFVELAQKQGAEAFITGEMKHHEILAALHAGVGVILAGHTNTERGYLPRLAEMLRGTVPGIEVKLSEADRDPLELLKD
ncbi:MAG: Nif3-like dinuclear metal center hexameric protein [Planctomycetota bacterium]